MILACDVGTTSGWVAGAPGTTPKRGFYKFAGELKEDEEIFYEFGCWISNLMRTYDLQYYARHDLWIPRIAGNINIASSARLFGMDAIGLMMARKYKLKILRCSIAKIDAFIAKWRGQEFKKGMKKIETMELMCDVIGRPIVDENVGDAGAVWCYWEHHLAPSCSVDRGFGTLFPPKAQQRKAVVVRA